MTPERGLRERTPARWFRTQGDSRQNVGPDIQTQYLQHTQRQWKPTTREGPDQKWRQLGDVICEVIRQKTPRIRECGSSLFDCRDDGGEVVVEQHQGKAWNETTRQIAQWHRGSRLLALTMAKTSRM